jgi:serine/threonine protein kinase
MRAPSVCPSVCVAQEAIVDEARIMMLQQHAHVLPLYSCFVEGTALWMVMPYVAGGSAYDIMRNGSPDVSLGYFWIRFRAQVSRRRPRDFVGSRQLRMWA